MLFEKINRLDWYQGLLQQWISDNELNSKTVLEVGCASGQLTQYLDEINFKPTGVDLSINSIKLAKKSYPNIAFEQQDVSQLSYTDGSFDNVIAASLINIVPNKHKALNEMVRVCKTGGKISILVPNKVFDDEQFNVLLKSLKLSGFSLAALKTWNRLAPKVNTDDMTQLLIDVGIEEIKINSYLNGMVISFMGVVE